LRERAERATLGLMPALHSIRMERFARFYFESGNAAASYLKAGYKPSSRNTLDSAASRLTRSVKVKARIRELSKHMITRNRITVDSLLEDLAQDRALARELGQPSAAISATQLSARLVGLLVDRKEQGGPGAFSEASEAEVLAMVRRELGDDSAAALAAALAREDAVPAAVVSEAVPGADDTIN